MKTTTKTTMSSTSSSTLTSAFNKKDIYRIYNERFPCYSADDKFNICIPCKKINIKDIIINEKDKEIEENKKEIEIEKESESESESEIIRKRKLLEHKRKSSNRMCYQLCFLIYLLNNIGYSFNIKKLYKSALTTLQLFKIIYYIEPNSSIINTIELDKEINLLNIKTHKKRNYDVLLNNLLINKIKLNNNNCKIEYFTSKKLGEFSYLRIISLVFNKNIYFSEDITKIGIKIYNYIYNFIKIDDFLIKPYSLNNNLFDFEYFFYFIFFYIKIVFYKNHFHNI